MAWRIHHETAVEPAQLRVLDLQRRRNAVGILGVVLRPAVPKIDPLHKRPRERVVECRVVVVVGKQHQSRQTDSRGSADSARNRSSLPHVCSTAFRSSVAMI